MLKLFKSEIADLFSRKNFEKLESEITGNPILSGEWRFYTIAISSSVTNYKFKHNLSFTPTDVIQTSLTGAGALTWNYSNFTDTYVDITTTAACTVRVFIGRVDNA